MSIESDANPARNSKSQKGKRRGSENGDALPVSPETEPKTASNSEQARKLPPDLQEFADLVFASSQDTGAAFEDAALVRIADLRTTKPASYERLRAFLKDAGVRVSELDRRLDRIATENELTDQTVTTARCDPKTMQAAAQESPPYLPRLKLNDVTIQKVAVIAEAQPKGVLIVQDEMSAFLGNLSRYANGGSDRGFWTAAYGGRSFDVDRISRPPVHVRQLTITLVGGIQPEPLHSLMIQTPDDGMFARFLPIYPRPAPITRPRRTPDETMIVRAFGRMYDLPAANDDVAPKTALQPQLIKFDDAACERVQTVRHWVREQEQQESGLLLSFVGKAPGFVVRLAVVLAHLDWAISIEPVLPRVVTDGHVRRAREFFENYLLPMARRTYAEASVPMEVRRAQAIALLIVKERWENFTQRDITRRERHGLKSAAEVEPALDVLIQAGWILFAESSGPTGGRKKKVYSVVPRVHELAKAA